jgi:uncharacterized protein with NAD-binding domain and iron-sulfur cluster
MLCFPQAVTHFSPGSFAVRLPQTTACYALSSQIPRFCSQVLDSAVLRFPQAVTHFSPGSYASRPLQTTSFGNLFMAGDWVKDVPHGANGLSQVPSLVVAGVERYVHVGS